MKRQSILVVMVVLLLATIPAYADLSSGLVAYYRFQNNAHDRSGNKLNGTVYGATFVKGIAGKAILLDGIDDYVTVPYSDDFQLQAFTLSAWISPSVDLSLTGGVIAGRGEDAVSDRASYIFDVPAPLSQFGSGLRLVYEDNGDREQFFDTGYIPPVDTWTHLVTTRSLAGQVTIYVNGTLYNQWLSSPAITTQCFQDFTIGARWWNPTGSGGVGPDRLIGFFSGTIDEVRIYDRALSASEIEQLSVVPVPSAFLLGILGLGVAGRKLRRRKTA